MASYGRFGQSALSNCVRQDEDPSAYHDQRDEGEANESDGGHHGISNEPKEDWGDASYNLMLPDSHTQRRSTD